jgi:hypothetical protein
VLDTANVPSDPNHKLRPIVARESNEEGLFGSRLIKQLSEFSTASNFRPIQWVILVLLIAIYGFHRNSPVKVNSTPFGRITCKVAPGGSIFVSRYVRHDPHISGLFMRSHASEIPICRISAAAWP